jgi:hypothetical protein
MKIELTFTEPLLATCSGNKEIATEFILSKRPEGIAEDEQESLPEQDIEKSSTVFMQLEDGTPFLWDYQIKGFFKAAASALNRSLKKEDQFKAHKKIIDTLIFVRPRRIPIQLSGPITILERPLRGQTAQGERIALARSESAPAGSKIVIEILCLDPKLESPVKLWLDYGQWSGLGQWRSASYGRFVFKILTE